MTNKPALLSVTSANSWMLKDKPANSSAVTSAATSTVWSLVTRSSGGRASPLAWWLLANLAGLLSRPDNFNRLKPVAANIDRIVIVIAPEPLAHANLIDRYLVAAEHSDITPVLLLNKSDLIDPEGNASLLNMVQRYRDIGYDVLTASCASEGGLSDLKALLDGHISAFVGQSGVGKSSLVNRLITRH